MKQWDDNINRFFDRHAWVINLIGRIIVAAFLLLASYKLAKMLPLETLIQIRDLLETEGGSIAMLSLIFLCMFGIDFTLIVGKVIFKITDGIKSFVVKKRTDVKA